MRGGSFVYKWNSIYHTQAYKCNNMGSASLQKTAVEFKQKIGGSFL